mgnify:CR=1 FL=1
MHDESIFPNESVSNHFSGSDCKNVAKISFAAGPFGMATICVLSPGLNNVIIFDKYEVNGEDVIKAKDGLRNRRIINWTYKLLGDTKLELEDY